MFGNQYYLEELNLAPVGDYVPQDDFQQQMGYSQQMQQVMLQQQQLVQPFDYVADALRQQQQALRLADNQRESAVSLQRENLRLQRELQEARMGAARAPTQEEIERLVQQAAARLQLQQQPPLTEAQRQQERQRLMEEVYGDDGPAGGADGFAAPEDVRSAPANTGETFAPVPWGSENDVGRVNVGE